MQLKGEDWMEALRKIEIIKIDEEYLNFGLPVAEIMHSYRVAKLAIKIGSKIELSTQQLMDLYTGAIFHDIGKAKVDKRILGKKGKLSIAERKIIDIHPIYSAEYIDRIDNLRYLKNVVKAHHERWDGTGYPDGLRKEKIPLLSRIISIADVYDALTNKRVYRDFAFTKEQAKEIMFNNSGKQFDPKLLEVFFSVV